MLTRLRVKNFKNLVDVEVYFGPFNCIIGENGVGKSNLFDVIELLRVLAEGKTPTEAILSLRDDGRYSGDLRSVFHKSGDVMATRIMIAADMIIPPRGVDYRNAEAIATTTFVVYEIHLEYKESTSLTSESVVIAYESLERYTQAEARTRLSFPHKGTWRKSVVVGTGRRNQPAYISTDENTAQLHQDGGSRGRPLKYDVRGLPRTLLSTTSVADSPTGLLAKLEMSSWRMLQLEPTALRRPNNFNEPMSIGANGDHLASTLFRLANLGTSDTDQVYATIRNRLSELIGDVGGLMVDRDIKRELYTLLLQNTDGTVHAARNLSDGTLRFLGLAVLEQDPENTGVLCLEEPENGIHPTRVGAMLSLLQTMATDVELEVDQDNPLRQVIVNTHAQLVTQQVEEASLVLAKPITTFQDGKQYTQAQFYGLTGTWRSAVMPTTSVIDIMPYVTATAELSDDDESAKRLIDRDDVKQLLLDFAVRPE